MNRRRILIVGALMLLALMLMVIPVSASATRIEVEAFEIKCLYDPGVENISDGIYHARDGLQQGYRLPLSPNDPIDEKMELENTVNLNLNFKTGKGNGWGEFVSENFAGTWTGKLIEWMPGIWLTSGKSVGYGISPEFAGWELRVEWDSIDPSQFNGMCDGANPVSATYAQATYLIPDD